MAQSKAFVDASHALNELSHALALFESENSSLRGAVNGLTSENAKLRELARAAWRCIHTGATCSDCRLIAGGCTLQSAMRELEVSDG